MDDPQALAQRLTDLDALAARLDEEPRVVDRHGKPEPPHGWFARAIGDTIAAKLEQVRRDSLTPAQEVQCVLESGLTAWPLYQALTEQFPQIQRRDAFLGAAMAITGMVGRVRLAELERTIAQVEAEALRSELAALKAPVAA